MEMSTNGHRSPLGFFLFPSLPVQNLECFPIMPSLWRKSTCDTNTLLCTSKLVSLSCRFILYRREHCIEHLRRCRVVILVVHNNQTGFLLLMTGLNTAMALIYSTRSLPPFCFLILSDVLPDSFLNTSKHITKLGRSIVTRPTHSNKIKLPIRRFVHSWRHWSKLGPRLSKHNTHRHWMNRLTTVAAYCQVLMMRMSTDIILAYCWVVRVPSKQPFISITENGRHQMVCTTRGKREQ
jgi:hypothetical protein